MRRRLLLILAGGTLAGFAGCASDEADRSAESPTTSPIGTETPERTHTPDVDDRLDVRLDAARYYVRTFEANRHGITPADVTPEAEIPPILRDALYEALDGGFETDDPSDRLLAAIDEFRHVGVAYRFEPYVRLDGEAHVFDATVPEFTAELDPDADDPDPERTAHWEDDVETDEVSAFVRTIAATGPHSPRDEYRMSLVPDTVSAFLDRYNYLETPHTTGRIETDVVDPGPSYTISIRKFEDEDWWGRPVLDADTLSEELRQFLDAAVASDRRAPALEPGRTEYRTDTLPEDYADELVRDEADPFVRIDDTVYGVSVREPDRDRTPIDVDVSVVSDADDERPQFRETVAAQENPDVKGRIEVASEGAVPSVLWIQTAEGRVLLESDANETIEWETVEGAGTDRRIANVEKRDLHPEGLADTTKTVSASYAVPEEVPAGTYDAWGRLHVEWSNPDPDRRRATEPYPFHVSVTVKK